MIDKILYPVITFTIESACFAPLETKHAIARTISPIPPILEIKIMDGSLVVTPNNVEITKAGIKDRANPVAPSISAVTLSNIFIGGCQDK